MRIPGQIKKELKRPLGRVVKDFSMIKILSRNHRIISVGDICTLGLLAVGIKPHLAVFDYRFMRQGLDSGIIEILAAHFSKPKRYRNPAGTLSKEIIQDAAKLIADGGGVLIEGEEDITALAFIMAADANDIVIYGQPHKGLVIVKPDEKIKRKIRSWLASAMAF